MKFNIIIKIILINVFFFSAVTAEIITTNNFNIIKNTVASANKDTLVIFDVDHVLLQQKDQVLKHYPPKKLLPKLSKKLRCYLVSIILMRREIEPVNKDMINLINTIQQKNIKVIALTHCAIGNYGKIKSLENWRIKELKKLGYNFNKSWPKFKTKNNLKQSALFKQGILFTNGHTKGETLKAFLEYAQLTPKKIIFIDDKRKFLESVEDFSKQSNIEFVGIEYNAVASSCTTPLNEQRAKLQYKILEQEHKWLSDQEVDSLTA